MNHLNSTRFNLRTILLAATLAALGCDDSEDNAMVAGDSGASDSGDNMDASARDDADVSDAGDDSGGAALLAGDDTASALAALPMNEPVAVAPSDVIGDILLTRLRIVLEADATIGDFNTAASLVNASGINFSRPGSPHLTLVVPRASGLPALEALAASLNGQPGIAFADVGRQFAALELPAADDETAAYADLQHTLATRFPAAWNVRDVAAANCDGRRVTVLVPDFYRAPHDTYDMQVPGASPPDRVTDPDPSLSDQPHGYRTSALISAKFDALRAHGANPLPQCLQLKLINAAGLDLSEMITAQLIPAVAQTQGPVIISSSIGFRHNNVCGASGVETCTSAEEVTGLVATRIQLTVEREWLESVLWAEQAMQPAFLGRVLVVQAAGNDADSALGLAYPALRDARLGSHFAMAAALNELDTLLTDAALWQPKDSTLRSLAFGGGQLGLVKNLRDQTLTVEVSAQNLLLVGSATNTEQPKDAVRSTFSNDGASVLAVGEGVFSIDELDVAGDEAALRGTSYATPQVAGLASYLWLLDDEPQVGGLDLRLQPPAETIRLIEATARPTSGASAGLVDAYNAVLALDARKGNRNVRLALLDVSGPLDKPDGVFDALDLQKFSDVYDLANPSRVDPVVSDDSRFDLNGDGFTGGRTQLPFDLDADSLSASGAPIITSAQEPIDGRQITFGEGSITDLEVLCFYAYGNDFDVSKVDATDERTRLLGPVLCGDPCDTVNAPQYCPVCFADATCDAPEYSDNQVGQVSSSCCGLIWQQAVGAGTYDWAAAETACGAGWRLPTIAELYSLVVPGQTPQNPTIDRVAFPSTPADFYWSSTAYDGSTSYAWGVDFAGGHAEEFSSSQLHPVLCVH